MRPSNLFRSPVSPRPTERLFKVLWPWYVLAPRSLCQEAVQQVPFGPRCELPAYRQSPDAGLPIDLPFDPLEWNASIDRLLKDGSAAIRPLRRAKFCSKNCLLRARGFGNLE